MISQSTDNSSITLIATNEVGSIHRYELQPDKGVFVGSSDNCGLQLHGAELAEIHCRIGVEEGKVWVQDWMSNDGTRVNGETISSKVEVQHGDRIEIGKHQIELADAKTSKETSSVSENDRYQTISEPAPEPEPASEPVAPSLADSDSETSHTPVYDGNSDQDRDHTDVLQSNDPVINESEVKTDITPESSFAAGPESMDFNEDFFDLEEEETYDRETVSLLQAEIEDLQAALAQRDAERFDLAGNHEPSGPVVGAEETDEVLQRMQDLVNEANQSDERVAILEEMLHAAEDASRTEQEERQQLEGWVGDIEQRIGQREEEHAAEVEALKQRIEDSSSQQELLQRKLRKAASGGSAPKQYEETLENLQGKNQQLQDELADSKKESLSLRQRLDNASEGQESSLREERAKLAKEQAEASRLRYDLSSKLAEIEAMPKSENTADREASEKIQTLRQHLREIHEQEKQEEKEATLATRLAKLWKRVEY